MRCHSFIFSSQGQVNSIIITTFSEIEYKTMSGLKTVIAINDGKTNLECKSHNNFQSQAAWSSPEKLFFFDVLTFVPAFTNFIDDILETL